MDLPKHDRDIERIQHIISDVDSSLSSDRRHSIAISISEAPAYKNAYLISTQENAILPKDFQTEIRGILDVEHLLKHATVLLDADYGNLEILVDE
uniref:DUF2326 domain-containing protein n=1 Tax=Panagrellus redivivus TaxID=6233 RepID=A0A7E4UUC1_PANRE